MRILFWSDPLMRVIEKLFCGIYPDYSTDKLRKHAFTGHIQRMHSQKWSQIDFIDKMLFFVSQESCRF